MGNLCTCLPSQEAVERVRTFETLLEVSRLREGALPELLKKFEASKQREEAFLKDQKDTQEKMDEM